MTILKLSITALVLILTLTNCTARPNPKPLHKYHDTGQLNRFIDKL